MKQRYESSRAAVGEGQTATSRGGTLIYNPCRWETELKSSLTTLHMNAQAMFNH